MSSRLAQLAARLDALSRMRPPEEEPLRIVRAGFGLAVPLPAAMACSLAVQEGDQVEVRVVDDRVLQIMVNRQEPGMNGPR